MKYAALLCLALMGCASANMRETVAHGDLDRDGCIAYRCKAYCKADATPEQIKAFNAGVIDEGEAKQLKRLKLWIGADTATTIGALAVCEAVKEANPILGSNPSAFAVVLYNGVAYAITHHQAAESPYWCSTERQIRIAANIRVAASINNAVVLAVCK